MNTLVRDMLDKAQEDGVSFKGWTYTEIAAAIKMHTKTEHSIKDLAAEVKAMHETGEIDFV
ncbi:hypothetical protein HOR97_gp20 [Agrobacterium phage Atu_ph03]|uniref:Uncharacterized protein n=2 Tax=Atuphduovirus TaxID=2731928 RepID=A0A2L0UYX6_9CAUD|nr:hypothetical protein HOR96_gp18 [Agrobacterium phage Atu_ph02]YP_009791861.1 hypothetical protein HOR97_gp20 [Agrobacterium phage Atu_ph03]AUZ94737.1 hypothetical protein [Agrobacterium phage Atu_ph02]AUZ94778.1 hypothetical protein [Agrobacterium phage Atu_ph03]